MSRIKYLLGVMSMLLIFLFSPVCDRVYAQEEVIAINAGESYKILNMDIEPHDIPYFENAEIAVYSNDGTGVLCWLSSYGWDMIPAGGYMIITATAQTSITIDTDFFSCSVSNLPALDKVEVKKDETYEFINNSAIDLDHINTCSNERPFDYAVYYSDGTAKEVVMAARYNIMIRVPAGGRLVVTPTLQDITFATYYGSFTAQSIKTPALAKVTVYSGESYEFINHDDVEHEWLHNAEGQYRWFDYVIYNGDGTVARSDLCYGFDSLNVPAGGRIVITVTSNLYMVCGSYYDYFTYDPSSIQALSRVTAKTGESYQFINNNMIVPQQIHTKLNYGNRYAYTVFNGDGTVKMRVDDAEEEDIFVPTGGKVLIEIISGVMEFGGNSRHFTMEPTDNYDGITWVPQLSHTGRLNSIAWGNNKYVAIGEDYYYTKFYYTSFNGIVWNRKPMDPMRLPKKVIFDGQQFVASGSYMVLTSLDGENWTEQPNWPLRDLSIMVYNQGLYVASTTDGIFTTSDLQSWTKRVSTTDSILSIVYENNQFVAVGKNGSILTSEDGYSWVQRASGTSSRLDKVTWTGSQYLVIGADGMLLSYDGVTWTAQAFPGDEAIFSCIKGPDRIILVGEESLYTSYNGDIWSKKMIGTTRWLFDCVWNGTQYLAVGDHGVILRGMPNPLISSTYAVFDKKVDNQKDISVTIDSNVNRLSTIDNGGTLLVNNQDYVVEQDQITFKKEYLSMLQIGSTTLSFEFINGKRAVLFIYIFDSENFVIAPPVFKNLKGDTVTQLSGNTTITATVRVKNYSTVKQPVVAVFVLFSGDKQLCEITSDGKEMRAGEVGEFTGKINVPDSVLNPFVKILVWDSLEGMKPLSKDECYFKY